MKKFLTLWAILAIALIPATYRLYAQDEDVVIEEEADDENATPEQVNDSADPDAESANKTNTGPPASDDEEEDDVVQMADPSDELFQPASMWPEGDFIIITPSHANGSKRNGTHLGPTGIWGDPYGQNIYVTQVKPGSPAEGKINVGDFIYGVNGKPFSIDVDFRRQFSEAITQAETKEGGGILNLDVRQKGRLVQVPIQLEVMGSYSDTMPYNCEKSEKIVALAEDYMQKGMRPESGWPMDGEYMYGPFHDSALFALSTGNPKMLGLVRRYIRANMDKTGPSSMAGWSGSFLKILFGEYYHLTGDSSVLPYLEPLPGSLEKDWSWPPKEPTAYGTHPHQQMAFTMGDILANEAGVGILQERLKFDLLYLYVKRAEYGYVKYIGYGKKPIEARQIDAVEIVPPSAMERGTFSAMNGKPAMAAVMYSMVEGYEEAVKQCSLRSVYAFDVTNKGHGGHWFNNFWTPIGASKADPALFAKFMKGQSWRRELSRDHTGGMWQTGHAKGKMSAMGTGWVIHHCIPRKKLRMLGAPRSMFGPAAPEYMKEALAAHGRRDYATAEQLVLKLQADGKVPAEDEERVNHFLSSVKMVKESIDHDLKVAEEALRKQNYILASLELGQLKMVVSPNNQRLQNLEKMVESKRDQIPDMEKLLERHYKEVNAKKEVAKKAAEKRNDNEISSQVLIKDGARYVVSRSRKSSTKLPEFTKDQLHTWNMRVIGEDGTPPEGWEAVDFNDSDWTKAVMPYRWRPKPWKPHYIALFRTTFDVSNVESLRTLRFRFASGGQRNVSIYLNGNLIAKAGSMPLFYNFDLPESLMDLVQNGKNTLAIRTQRGPQESGYNVRVTAIQGERTKSAEPTRGKVPPKPAVRPQTGSNVKPSPTQPQNLAPHHKEIESMLGYLKQEQPKMKIGENTFTGTEVYDYLSSMYQTHQEKITSTDLFLDKVATKSPSGLIYYVIDENGGTTLLKDWLQKGAGSK